uniref:Protein sel-1-like protein 1 n=1 Tax=Rhabditophanes sp. KR3021 TaxID=114890 RepID=A0AC35U1L7_9BILA
MKIKSILFILLVCSLTFIRCDDPEEEEELMPTEKSTIILTSEKVVNKLKNKKQTLSISDISADDVNNIGAGVDENIEIQPLTKSHSLYEELTIENITIPSVSAEDLQLGESLFKEAIDKLTARETVPLQAKITAYDLLNRAASLKHTEAMKIIVYGDIFGHFGQKKINMEYLNELASHGSADAHMMLGFLYSNGIGVPKDPRKAVTYYSFAALNGNTIGEMAMAYRYASGINVLEKCDQALYFYSKVARKVMSKLSMVGGTAVNRIKLMDEEDSLSSAAGTTIFDRNLLEYYTLMADKGDHSAMHTLGMVYLTGSKGIDHNLDKALEYLRRGAQDNNFNSVAYLGRMYLEGTRVTPQNNLTAFNYFKKAAGQGNVYAYTSLGYMYLFGRGVNVDYKKALKLFAIAVEQSSHPEAQMYLGYMNLKGLAVVNKSYFAGITRDFAVATKHFQQAGTSGSIQAFYWMAQMYTHGLGVGRKCETAVDLMKVVVERGKWGSNFHTAYNFYKNGQILESITQYLLYADAGYDQGQSNAAFIMDKNYEANATGLFDPKNILQMWKRSAEQNNADARIKLGDYLYYGKGTEKNFKDAAAHYKIAAEKFLNSGARFNLGYMHEHGIGLPKDLHLAKRYYDSALEVNSDAILPVTLAFLPSTANKARSKSIGAPSINNTETNWNVILFFLSDHQTQFEVKDIKKKQYNLCTAGNFLDYLKVIIWHFDVCYEVADLHKDTIFWLNAFGYTGPIEARHFHRNSTTNRFIMQAFAWFIEIVMNKPDIQEMDTKESGDVFVLLANIIKNAKAGTVKRTAIKVEKQHFEGPLKDYLQSQQSKLENDGKVNDLIASRNKKAQMLKEIEKIDDSLAQTSNKIELCQHDKGKLEKFQKKLEEHIGELMQCVVRKTTVLKINKEEFEEMDKKFNDIRTQVSSQEMTIGEAKQCHLTTRQHLSRAENQRSENAELGEREWALRKEIVDNREIIQTQAAVFLEETNNIVEALGLKQVPFDETNLVLLNAENPVSLAAFEIFASSSVTQIKNAVEERNVKVNDLLMVKEQELRDGQTLEDELENELKVLKEKQIDVAAKHNETKAQLQKFYNDNAAAAERIQVMIQEQKRSKNSKLAEELLMMEERIKLTERENKKRRFEHLTTSKEMVCKNKKDLQMLKEKLGQIEATFSQIKTSLSRESQN